MQVVSMTPIAVQKVFALRTVSMRVTRDGAQTSNLKVVELLDQTSYQRLVFFVLRDGYACTDRFLASAIDRSYLLLVKDSIPPMRAAARYPTIVEDVTFNLDLNDGIGSGAVGSPATFAARVRVDGLDTAREVLAVERQTDGAWRIAGNLRTADGDLDLRVIGGEVYALALDDYGYIYQPNLAVAVDDTIRPTVYAGWLYRITEAGTLPATEPEWWPIDGDNAPRPLGTARAVAVRYYRPLAHGPVSVEMI